MKNEIDSKEIDKAIELLESKIHEGDSCVLLPSSSQIKVDDKLENALFLVNSAYAQLCFIGKDKLEKIGKILNYEEYIASECGLNGFHNPTKQEYAKELSVGHLNCACKILQTYQTVQNWQAKVEEFRKIKSLDSIL